MQRISHSVRQARWSVRLVKATDAEPSSQTSTAVRLPGCRGEGPEALDRGAEHVGEHREHPASARHRDDGAARRDERVVCRPHRLVGTLAGCLAGPVRRRRGLACRAPRRGRSRPRARHGVVGADDRVRRSRRGAARPRRCAARRPRRAAPARGAAAADARSRLGVAPPNRPGRSESGRPREPDAVAPSSVRTRWTLLPSIASLLSASASLFFSRGIHSKSTLPPASEISAHRSRASRARRRMSSCLIFQRPDICSTTSLESILTRDRRRRGRGRATARSPASRPEYSATLLLGLAERLGQLDEDRAGRGVTDEGAVAGDARVAPGPAVGLDDEPAARPARRRLHQRSQTGLGRADHDAAALLAAHDLVLRAPCGCGRGRRCRARAGSRRSGGGAARRRPGRRCWRGSSRRARRGPRRRRRRCRPGRRRPCSASASSFARAASARPRGSATRATELDPVAPRAR